MCAQESRVHAKSAGGSIIASKGFALALILLCQTILPDMKWVDEGNL
jgi:hypothetical protein